MGLKAKRAPTHPLWRVALFVVVCVMVAATIDGALFLVHRAAPSAASPTSAPYTATVPTATPITSATPPPETRITLQPGFMFRAADFQLQQWPLDLDEYGEYPLQFDPTSPRDSSGAKVKIIGGKTYYHPVVLAEDGNEAMYQYAQTGTASDLATAETDAHALIAHRVDYAGGWWYPYPFDFALHGLTTDVEHAPWYSAMSQGEALYLFDRLFTATKDEQWHAAADATFKTFLVPYHNDNSTPWIVNVDQDGYVWLQEYPGPKPDYTINGMNFATVGLINYYLLFQDARARQLVDGTLETMLHAMNYVNHPGWLLGYCLSHETPSAHYHGIVTQQMALLYSITRDPRFAAWALTLIDEYPIPEVRGSVHVPAGTYTLLKTNDAQRVIASNQVTLSSTMSVAVSMRLRVAQQPGYWYEMASGPYSGWLIQESTATVLAGQYNTTRFNPALAVTFAGGSYQSYAVIGTTITHPMPLAAAVPTQATIDMHTTIDGVTLWHVTGGQWANRWVAGANPVLALAG